MRGPSYRSSPFGTSFLNPAAVRFAAVRRSDIVRTTLLILPCLLTPGLAQAVQGADPVEAHLAGTLPGLVIDRGVGQLAYTIPRGELLEYRVVLDLALVGETKVGDFTLESLVEPFVTGLPGGGSTGTDGREAGCIRTHAWGKHLGYELDHVIESRVLPQAWPAILYRDTQRGSENRRREVRLGSRAGALMASYSSDGHCKGCERRGHFVEGTWPFSSDHHCEKCRRAEHREWHPYKEFEIPEGTVDMLGAIFMARELVREGQETVTFPLVDNKRVWDLKLTLGERKRIKAKAGTFDCREVLLKTVIRAGAEEGESFKGLFGIHGTIHLWMDETTGVPVRLGGSVPVGPIDLDVHLDLEKHSGTPPGFGKKATD